MASPASLETPVRTDGMASREPQVRRVRPAPLDLQETPDPQEPRDRPVSLVGLAPLASRERWDLQDSLKWDRPAFRDSLALGAPSEPQDHLAFQDHRVCQAEREKAGSPEWPGETESLELRGWMGSRERWGPQDPSGSRAPQARRETGDPPGRNRQEWPGQRETRVSLGRASLESQRSGGSRVNREKRETVVLRGPGERRARSENQETRARSDSKGPMEKGGRRGSLE